MSSGSDSGSDYEFGKRRKKKSKQKPAKRARSKSPPGDGINTCLHCRQTLVDNENLRFHQNVPEGAKEELEIIFEVENFSEGDPEDPRPEFRATQVTFYDNSGHIVGFDWSMLDVREEQIRFCGYIKNATDDSADAGNGIPAKDCGPIVGWWIAGHAKGENLTLGVTTMEAHYYLTAPSEEYKPFWNKILAKSFVSKIVTMTLTEAHENDELLSLTYDELLAKVEKFEVPEGMEGLGSEILINNVGFILQQVTSYEDAADDDEEVFMTDAPCMRTLIDLTGADKKKYKRKGSNIRSKGPAPAKMPSSKATTTQLVRTVFVEIFQDLMDETGDKGKKGGVRKRRCNVCENCMTPECGECNHCKDMVKFGGTGKSKQACVLRKCLNMVEKLFDIEASDDEEDNEIDAAPPLPPPSIENFFDKENNKNEGNHGDKLKGQLGIKDFTIKLEKLDLPSKALTQAQPQTVQLDQSGFSWLTEEPLRQYQNKDIYDRVQVGTKDVVWKSGDFVYHQGSIGQIVYFFEKRRKCCAHLKMYLKAKKTVLEECSDPHELFEVRECRNVGLSDIEGFANVKHWPIPENWAKLGDEDESLEKPPINMEDPKSYFFRMRYDEDSGKFEQAFTVVNTDISKLIPTPHICPICNINDEENVEEKIKPFKSFPKFDENGDQYEDKKFWTGFTYIKGETYRLDDAIFFNPKTSANNNPSREKGEKEEREIEVNENDSTQYPEMYRKKSKHEKGSNASTKDPFDIGIIKEIRSDPEEKRFRLVVRYLYRPHQVYNEKDKGGLGKDLNLVYWSEKERTIDIEQIQGKCFVRSENFISEKGSTPEQWTEEGEYRFYFDKLYNKDTKEFLELPPNAEHYGIKKSGKGKGGKGKSSMKTENKEGEEVNGASTLGALPKIEQPLKCLDVFAGCGGLSCGLHEAGIAESKWAIECYDAAAKSFKLNNRDTLVFNADCNLLLKKAMEAEENDDAAIHNGQRLPRKGEVELLCGGPPCQGFSGMNRFNSGQYSSFKNSLISSYLSFCDFYRPKFFILENVRNFASFKKSMVLKLCLRALTKMGYSCSFGILQAGHYGVAQTRRRCILLASAPGFSLPLHPEPLHTFAQTTLTVNVNDKRYSANQKWVSKTSGETSSAPFRTITVRDCMSDLPQIRNGDQKEVMTYEIEAETHFQRKIRKNTNGELRDHICKKMNALVEARMSLIPTYPGSDWRDLPNIVMRLSNGEYCQKLVYTHHDVIQGKHPETKALRGVCKCAESRGAKCTKPDKQENTLIPWCLPHTSNRHNQWAGLYGRLSWNGFFSTTVTNPEPMGKQGRVLHPDQHRVVSVRECARSQGFPDSYQFYGHVIDKHRQVGNAVPPPMGKAIGLEIRKALARSSKAEVKAEN